MKKINCLIIFTFILFNNLYSNESFFQIDGVDISAKFITGEDLLFLDSMFNEKVFDNTEIDKEILKKDIYLLIRCKSNKYLKKRILYLEIETIEPVQMKKRRFVLIPNLSAGFLRGVTYNIFKVVTSDGYYDGLFEILNNNEIKFKLIGYESK